MRQMALIGLALFLLVAGAGLHAAPGQWDNETDGYLFNGGFEGNFYEVGAGQVGEGWTRVHLSGNPNWMSTQVFAGGGWVEKMGGEDSQILSVESLSVGQPFETLLYQRVEGLTPGQIYSFSGWVLKMWGGSANTRVPEDPFSYGSWIGVDPTGGTDPSAATVIWGATEWQDEVKGHWENHRLAVRAERSQMTVFVRLWLKWQRAETQAIVDSFELFDAPRATIQPTSRYISRPLAQIEWVGELPMMYGPRGFYELYFTVQRQQADGSWLTLAEEIQDTRFALALAEGETAVLRVLPLSYQPKGGLVNWPPTTHIGLPSAPITLTLDTLGPTASLTALPMWSSVTPITVTWQGSDSGSGVVSYDVEYQRVGASEWQRWLSATAVTEARFGVSGSPVALQAGDEWAFRVRAHDAAGNVGAWGEVTHTALATGFVRGHILGADGQSLVGVTLDASPYPFSTGPLVGAFGDYSLALSGALSYTLSFRDAQGRTRLPDTVLTVTGSLTDQNWLLTPADNEVLNPHFEEAGGWQGSWQRVTGGASGAHAAQLAAGDAISQSVSVNGGEQLTLAWRVQSPDAVLRIQLGDEMWEERWSSGTSEWQYLILSPTGAAGSHPLRLSAVGATIWLDQVGLGTPDAAPRYQFLPIALR